MTTFDGPKRQINRYDSKFIRTERELFVTPPGDMTTLHIDLAAQHGIDGKIKSLREDNPTEVDGGYLSIRNLHEGGVIDVTMQSINYGLPKWDVGTEARLKTAAVIRELLPEYVVTTDRDEFPGAPKFHGKER